MTLHRPIWEMAKDIRNDYASKGKPLYFAAVPYVEAMETMSTMSDTYGADDAETVLSYALSNLSYWRGETADRVKREMRALLHEHAPTRYKRTK